LEFTPEQPIDFAWFDTVTDMRHTEYRRYHPHMHARTIVGFHDTAPFHPTRGYIDEIEAEGIVQDDRPDDRPGLHARAGAGLGPADVVELVQHQPDQRGALLREPLHLSGRLRRRRATPAQVSRVRGERGLSALAQRVAVRGARPLAASCAASSATSVAVRARVVSTVPALSQAV
jgi:hypothetical protein